VLASLQLRKNGRAKQPQEVQGWILGAATKSAAEQEALGKKRNEDSILSSGASQQGSGGTSEHSGHLMELEATVASCPGSTGVLD